MAIVGSGTAYCVYSLSQRVVTPWPGVAVNRHRSNLENILPPPREANRSSIHCKGYTSVLVALFAVNLKSQQILTVSLLCSTGTIGTAHLKCCTGTITPSLST